MKSSRPRRGWTVIPIFGRRMLSAPSPLRADGFELGFNRRKLFRGSLNLRALEPVLGREEPIASRIEQNHGHSHDRVVEGGQGSAGRSLRQDEENRYEPDPDHGDPADQVAPSSQMPGPALELLAGKQPEKNGDSIGDVEPDHRD